MSLINTDKLVSYFSFAPEKLSGSTFTDHIGAHDIRMDSSYMSNDVSGVGDNIFDYGMHVRLDGSRNIAYQVGGPGLLKSRKSDYSISFWFHTDKDHWDWGDIISSTISGSGDIYQRKLPGVFLFRKGDCSTYIMYREAVPTKNGWSDNAFVGVTADWPEDLKWHHITITFEAGFTMKLYIDGVLAGEKQYNYTKPDVDPTLSDRPGHDYPYSGNGMNFRKLSDSIYAEPEYNKAPCQYDQYPWFGQQFVAPSGVFAELSVWDRTLTASEVKMIYDNNKAGVGLLEDPIIGGGDRGNGDTTTPTTGDKSGLWLLGLIGAGAGGYYLYKKYGGKR